ncbi:MAG TPA: hypothetical protein VFE29_00920 [Terriglobia bacterium]|nr:hypothetical protein [Terriglobia bacterium]
MRAASESPSVTQEAAVASRYSGIGMEQLWLLFPVFLVIYKSFIFPLPPLDFWWHLKAGEVIATTGAIPRVDTFSFTAEGRPFILQNWLGELIYYWTYQAGGFPLLVLLGALLTVTAFLLMYRLCRDATPHARIVALVGFLAALANYGFLRPQTYSFLLFSAFYLVLWRYREHGWDRLWILPPLMAVWANLHGAFVMGLALIALYAGSEGLRRLIDPRRTDAMSTAQLRKLLLVFGICCLATLINPEGYRIYDYVRSVLLDAGSQQLVAEWQPPSVNTLLGFLLFYCPFLLAIVVFIRGRVKPDLTEMVLFFAFAILGLSSIRNAAWFGTIAFPLIARYLPLVDLSPLYPLRRFNAADQLSQTASPDAGTSQVYGRINLVLLVAAVAVLVTQSPWLRPALTGKSLLAEQTPIGAADFIEKQGITGRIFHPQEFGDYLIWRLWPQQKTLVDGRVHLFDVNFLKQYERAHQDPLSSDFMERWKIEYLLLSKSPSGSDARTIGSVRNSEVWMKIYEDDVAVLFSKQRP